MVIATATIHTGVNFEQAAVTTAGLVVCLIAVLTFAYSRWDKGRKEIADLVQSDKAELRTMITTIAAALGVRLDQVDGRLQKQGEDIAEIKGMSRMAERLDRGEKRAKDDGS